MASSTSPTSWSEPIYELWVPGDPIAKQRPRFQSRRRGGTYTPQATIDWEDAIRAAWVEAGFPELDQTVKVAVEVQRGGVFITVEPSGLARVRGLRGDLDNYVKSVLDGLATKTSRKTGETWMGGLKNDKTVTEIEAWFNG